MLKIRRSLGRLIFNMGIAIPGKTVFLIETAPWKILWYALNVLYIKANHQFILKLCMTTLEIKIYLTKNWHLHCKIINSFWNFVWQCWKFVVWIGKTCKTTWLKYLDTWHYMTVQITGHTSLCSETCLDKQHRKHQSYALLAFYVRRIRRSPVVPLAKAS